MTSSSDGSKVYIFYVNDLGNDLNGGPLGRVMIKTFENGSLGGEVGVSDLDGQSRLFPFAVVDETGDLFLMYNNVQSQRMIFRKRDLPGVWGPETWIGYFDQDVFAYYEGVPWADQDGMGDLHVAWLCGGQHGSRKIHYRKHFPDTNTWDPPLYNDPTALVSSLDVGEIFCSLVADQSHDVWAFWHNEITSGFNIEYRRRTSSGWQSLSVLSTASGDAESPVCTGDSDNNIHVLWSDSRNAGNWDVYYKKMDAIPYPPATLTYENFNGYPKLIWNKGKSKDTAGYKVYRGANVISTKNSSTDTTHVDMTCTWPSPGSILHIQFVPSIHMFHPKCPIHLLPLL